jgi:hypothetical protein
MREADVSLMRRCGAEEVPCIPGQRTVSREGAAMSARWMDKRLLVLLLPLALPGCVDLGIHDAASLLVPTFRRSEIVGIVAGFGITLPVYRTCSPCSSGVRARA